MLVVILVASVGAVQAEAPPDSGVPKPGSPDWRSAELSLGQPGAALAAALRAQRNGDATRAAWLFGETAARHPIVGDWAELLRARVLIDDGRSSEAIASLEAAAARYPDSPLAPELRAALGDAYARAGQDAAARAAWQRAIDSGANTALTVAALASIARSQERSGRLAEAADAWLVLWQRHPLSPEGVLAGVQLDRLEPRVGVRRTPETWRARGDRLFRKRRNEAALAAYDRALAEGLSSSERARVERQRAQTFFRLRDYPRAVEAFGAMPQMNDIPIWYARSLARSGRVPESIERFERLAEVRGSSIALRARYLAGLLLDGRGFSDRANAHFRSLAHAGQGSSLRRASLWRLGWSAYREDRCEDALGLLEDLVAEADDPLDGLRPRYWRARCLEALAGEAAPSGGAAPAPANPAATPSGAIAEYEALARSYPLAYYGWRARMRLVALGHEPPTPERVTLPELGPLLGPSDSVRRARILLEAGLEEAADRALARAVRNATGLRRQLEVAQLYRDAGNYRDAQRLMLTPYAELLARGPAPLYEEVWWHAWPAAFGGIVNDVTAADGAVEPALVFSIMREESGFQPRIVSPVGARGLLQIMEPTGERLARAVGRASFQADDLFVPRINVELGAYYLAELTAQFDGRLSAAIASYNAGPEIVREWLTERAADDDDEWVEAIPYEQTRAYVKRVLRSLQAYRLLY